MAHCFINRQRFTAIFMFPAIHRLHYVAMYVKCTKPSPFESFMWQNYKPTKAPIMGLLQNSTLNVPKGLSSYFRFWAYERTCFCPSKIFMAYRVNDFMPLFGCILRLARGLYPNSNPIEVSVLQTHFLLLSWANQKSLKHSFQKCHKTWSLKIFLCSWWWNHMCCTYLTYF